MLEYELSIYIDRPVEEVFEYVTNPKNIPQWATYIQQASQTPAGPIGVGSQIKHVIRGREVTWEVTAYEPNTTCKYEADYWYASNAEVIFRVQASKGGTTFIVHDKGERKGFMRLLGPVLGWNDRRVRLQQMATIKEILERDHSPAY